VVVSSSDADVSFVRQEKVVKKIPLAAALCPMVFLAMSYSAHAADSAAGQKTFQTTCAGCHQFKSYGTKSSAELETDIKGIVAGTVKHPKKLTLSDTDVANVAAYIAANEPK
jgi:mono/diheme cytochrome c family protein